METKNIIDFAMLNKVSEMGQSIDIILKDKIRDYLMNIKQELSQNILTNEEYVYEKYNLDLSQPKKKKKSKVEQDISGVTEENLDEGIPLQGHPYHDKSDAELHYIIKDAGEAAKNMRDFNPRAEAKYLDQINDAATILHYRRSPNYNNKKTLRKESIENLDENKWAGWTPKDIHREILKMGFIEDKGSKHAGYIHKKSGRKLKPIPRHIGDLPPGTTKGILQSAQRIVTESIEINELSTDLLNKYRHKANIDYDNSVKKANSALFSGDKKETNKQIDKAIKRSEGLLNANKKIKHHVLIQKGKETPVIHKSFDNKESALEHAKNLASKSSDHYIYVSEGYEGFNQLSNELSHKGVKNPKALAAWIGRKKYGNKKFQNAAEHHKKLGK